MDYTRIEKDFEFEDQEWKILNAVKKYYFDMYSAKALEEFSFSATAMI